MKPLMPNQPVTAKGELPSQELLEIIQRLTLLLRDHEARIRQLEP